MEIRLLAVCKLCPREAWELHRDASEGEGGNEWARGSGQQLGFNPVSIMITIVFK